MKLTFVAVPPMVWVPQQLVGASLGATVTIECLLEAHPAALHYWSRPDGQVRGFHF
jgi:neurotrimin